MVIIFKSQRCFANAKFDLAIDSYRGTRLQASWPCALLRW